MKEFKTVLYVSMFVYVVFNFLSIIDVYNNSILLRFLISTLTWVCILYFLGYRLSLISTELKNTKKNQLNYSPVILVTFIFVTLLIDIIYIIEHGYLEFVYEYSKIGFSKSLYVNVLSSLICAPVFEEFFYRHYIGQKLSAIYEKKTILILSSFLFAFSHTSITNFDLVNVVIMLIPGLFFGWLYIYKQVGFKKIIFIHFLFNLLTYIYSILVFIGLKFFSIKYNYNVIIILLLLIFIIIYFNKKYFKILFKSNINTELQ